MTDSLQQELRDRTVIEVTPAMIEAGVLELRERMIGEPLDRIVKGVFRAMVECGSAES